MSATTTDPNLPGPRKPSAAGSFTILRAVEADMLLEQAKGVLIFHFSVDAPTAQRILERWGEDSGAGLQQVAEALVHQVCQGVEGSGTQRWLTRWLEDRLRHGWEASSGGEQCGRHQPRPVRLLVDQSQRSLDEVVAAAREAQRTGAPLELAVAACWTTSTPAELRERMLDRLDLAAEVARSVAPGIEVRTEAREDPETD